MLIGPGAVASSAGGAGACTPNLGGRITLTNIEVDASIGYAERGYDGFPVLSRIETAATDDGASLIAWQTADRQSVVVTPVTASGEPSGTATLVPNALEIGGLVAQSEGFALLLRQPDPAPPFLQTPARTAPRPHFWCATGARLRPSRFR